MKHIFATIVLLASAATTAHAQFGSGIVYDPTQGAHAIQQIQQFEQQIQKAEQQIQKAEQIYTTALQTRNTIVAAYNLAHMFEQVELFLVTKRWTFARRAGNNQRVASLIQELAGEPTSAVKVEAAILMKGRNHRGYNPSKMGSARHIRFTHVD